jgi:hypothetical protein
MESIVESRSQIFSVAGDLFTVFGVHRMVAEGTRSNQKLLALREKGVYSSYTLDAYRSLISPKINEGMRIRAATRSG